MERAVPEIRARHRFGGWELEGDRSESNAILYRRFESVPVKSESEIGQFSTNDSLEMCVALTLKFIISDFVVFIWGSVIWNCKHKFTIEHPFSG